MTDGIHTRSEEPEPPKATGAEEWREDATNVQEKEPPPAGARKPPPVEDGARVDDRPRGPLDAAPGLLRLTTGAWLRTAAWTVSTSMRAGVRLAQAATSGEEAVRLVDEVGGEVRKQARRFLGLDLEDVARRVVPDRREGRAEEESTGETLRRRGEELLRRSADVHYEEDEHPAYERILAELAPDEGRVLRLLATQGPQPALDVRTWRPLDVGSEMVAPGLQMIGAEAGCRYIDRVPSYLNNLNRLGLIWFSREPLPDPLRYQVLEAQPEVLAALRRAGRGRIVRRSIQLTPFGEDFCAVCLPLDTAELEALPLPQVDGSRHMRNSGGPSSA